MHIITQFISALAILLPCTIGSISNKIFPYIGSSKIVGTWSLQCVTRSSIKQDSGNDLFYSGKSIHCYECPKYTFSSNNSGVIRTAGNRAIPFNWYLSKNSILIKNFPKGKINSYFLSNGRYHIIFSKKDNVVSIVSYNKMLFSYILNK